MEEIEMAKKDEITMKLTEEVAVLSENEHGYTVEVNYVDWNHQGPKLDIRNWHPGRERCGKGIALTEEESRGLYEALKKIYE